MGNHTGGGLDQRFDDDRCDFLVPRVERVFDRAQVVLPCPFEIDSGRLAYFDDWLLLAFAARDIKDKRFDDFVAALTASGPLVPVRKDGPK